MFLKQAKWKWFKYSEVFIIERGFYNKRPEDEGNMRFISASMSNNGVTDKVNPEIVEKKFAGDCITIVNNGHAGEAFYQNEEFTCSHDVNILRLKDYKMNVSVAMFLIPFIKKEKFRFNYGRKWRYERMGNSEIKLPVDVKGNPDWGFMENYIKKSFDMSPMVKKAKKLKRMTETTDSKLEFKKFKTFAYSDIFEIKKGKRVVMTTLNQTGNNVFVSAIDHNNGVSCYSDLKPNQKGNTITVNYDGNGVAEAFYQPDPYWALDSVNVLYPKFELNPYIAMFLITLIKKEKYRFSYGRKWHKERMGKSQIKLPVDVKGNPDWGFMENYIKNMV